MGLTEEELQRQWEEEEEERKERERERIRAIIQSYENKKVEADSLISSAEGYLNEYDGWLAQMISQLEVNNDVIEGQIATEYNRVIGVAERERNIIKSNYDTMIGDAISLAGCIQKKIGELIDELNSI